MRAWTDQGRLRCLRINDRGDRRYRVADLHAFLEAAGAQSARPAPFVTRLRPQTDLGESSGTSGLRLRSIGAQTPAVRSLSGLGTGMAGTIDAPLGTSRPRSATDPTVDEATDVGALASLWKQQLITRDLESILRATARALRDTGRFSTVAIGHWRDGHVVPRVVDGPHRPQAWWAGVDGSLVEVCFRDGRSIATPTSDRGPRSSSSPASTDSVEVYTPIMSREGGWGVLIVESMGRRSLGRSDLDLLQAAAAALSLAVEDSELFQRARGERAKAEALARISGDLSSRLEFPVIMSSLVGHARELFGADRAAVYRLNPDGSVTAEFQHNISRQFAEGVANVPKGSLGEKVIETRHAMAATDYADDPRAAAFREAVVREGFNTVAVAPLVADDEVLGVLGLYHDERYEWSAEDLHVLEALAAQAGIAMKNARNYQQMATWAAQLQSIQQLGTRLNRLDSVTAIAQAICTELRQLIDYHNVRVYRIYGDAVEPVAWRGEIGEYTDEDSDQLRLKVGQGVTGWVALHGVPLYLPNASIDPRSQTIPGTEDDLDESMLLAPMLFDDRVMGVIVLAKLGLNQFTSDDLRYLEIYASIAGQAFVNADATEQLEAQSERLARQLESQRELMRVTESILSTLDPHIVVEEIADRLGGLVPVDNLAINVYEPEAHLLRPIFARGIHAERFMARPLSDEQGVAGWVARNGEAQLVQDQQADNRVAHFEGFEDATGALIVAPLRGRDRVTGVLTLERLGDNAHFEEEEFELIQLFAGHVSIALQNALAHQAVEIRAQTDLMTGLKNQGTFKEYLSMVLGRGTPFSLLIVDLDDFKSFNDRRGHEAGNVLLADIAQGLRAACRDTDEVFRYGGDEFALILPATDANGAMEVAAKVGRAVRNVPAPGTRKPSGVTCSVGVASFPVDAADRSSLLLAADRACYAAKRAGRDRAASAADGLALAGDFLPQPPTPLDEPDRAKTAA